MPKRAIEDYVVDELRDDLAERGLNHLRVRRREDVLVIESGPRKGAVAHARLRRETVHLWRLEIATHTGEWQLTPLRDHLPALVEALVSSFGWTLEARERSSCRFATVGTRSVKERPG